MVRAWRTAGRRLMGARRRWSAKSRPAAGCRCSALGAAILVGRAEVQAPGGPWWAGFLLAALVLLAGLLVTCLRIVFPQDSPDKLAWWRDRGRKKRRGPGGGRT
jgi:hypothetical protein